MTSSKVEGEELVEGQGSKEASINEYIKRVEFLASVGAVIVQDNSLSAAPGAPTDEHVYVVAGTPAALDPWEGEGKSLAFYYNAGWIFVPPQEGWIVYNLNDGWRYEFDGTNWGVHRPKGRWSFGFKLETAPAVNDIIGRLATDTNIIIPASGNYGGPACDTAPGTTSLTIDLIDQSGPTVLGTVTITTGNSNTFATAGATAKEIPAGRMLIFKVTQADDGSVAGAAGTVTGFEEP